MKTKIVVGVLFAVAGLGTALWGSHDPANFPKHHHDSVQTAAEHIRLSTASLLALDGTPHTLADLPPQPRLVNFWATWCAPCVHEMPLLDAAQQNHRQVQFVGISMDEAALAKAFLIQLPVTYDIFTAKFDIFSFFSENGNKSGALPYTILMDAEGNIIAQKLGEFHSTEDIDAFILNNTP